MRPLPYAVHVVTGVLLLNMLVALFDAPQRLVAILLLAGPFLVIWMVWSVLRDRQEAMSELQDDAEWGYHDRTDLGPGRQ